jgi:oxygen-independent coproporphyrinogen-3 oxidase
MPAEAGLPPLGLYVHLPWCVRKCPYCDFNSHELRAELPGEEYCEALLRDLEQELPLVWGRPVHTVYFGGGTPSLFSAALIDQLIAGFRARLDLVPGAEITLEANPGTVERDRFSAYRDAGVNRVSLGAQSFDAASLKALGRIHGPEEIHTAIDSLRSAGIDNFNIDLMFGLPGQSLEAALDDVAQALAARPTHLSHYQLTLEPNTAFAANPPALPDEEQCWSMQEACGAALEAQGFEQYEISAWSLPGRQSRHNMNYWQFGDYLGIGAGAHGKLTLPALGEIRRRIRQRHPKRYLADEGLALDEAVSPKDLAFEYFLNALRLRRGFSLDEFTRRTGLDAAAVAGPLQEALERDLLEARDGLYRPTDLGWRFSNDLQALFLPD